MIKQVFNYIVAATIVISTTLTSCIKEDEIRPNLKGKLVETIIYNGGSEYSKFEYDNHNRITKYSKFTNEGTLLETNIVTYSGTELTKVDYKNLYPLSSIPYDKSYEFTKNGNIITVKSPYRSSNVYDKTRTSTLYVNNDGLPEKHVEEEENYSIVINYQYHNRNCVKYTYTDTVEGKIWEESYEYKYDDKKTPFYSCKTPKWFWIFRYSGGSALSQNNMIEEKNGNDLYPKDITKYEYVYDTDGYPTQCTITHSDGQINVTEFQYKK